MEEILALDYKLLRFLNNLGSDSYDAFWLFCTKQVNWIPLFAVIFYLIIKKTGWKHFGLIVLLAALLILITDQTTNLFKYGFERLRPCNHPQVKDHIRIVLERKSFSFFSGHASNSMATTTFFFLIFRKHYRYGLLLFLFPLIFAYSRIYLGLHFPSDILAGYLFGLCSGLIFYKLYTVAQKKYFPEI